MRRTLKRIWLTAAAVCVLASSTWGQVDPFASEVIDVSLNAPSSPDYLPAPGQFINNSEFNDPSKALGAPASAGIAAQDNSSIVSLGGFGGQIVLAFDHDVADSPANPMGLDAIVFSNAVWVSGESQYHWSEFATIEIMPELNGNSTPGDAPGEAWYIIPGSHLTAESYRSAEWTRLGDSQPEGAYPAYDGWPDQYTTGAHELSPTYQTLGGLTGILENPNHDDADPDNDEVEGYYGYAEYTPTVLLGDRDCDNDNLGTGDVSDMPAELFYTTPDDPMAVGMTPGSGGGDAFDIAWAVDANTWQAAGLDSFRYIRLTTAVDAAILLKGEVSAEIDAVADVRMVCDLDGDNDADAEDFSRFLAAMGSEWGDQEFNPAADILVDNIVDDADRQAFLAAWNELFLAGDASFDGVVDDDDLSLLLSNWNTQGGWDRGDFNADGFVDDDDLSLLLSHWGDQMPPAGVGTYGAAVPEPATFWLLGAAIPAVAKRRKRKGERPATGNGPAKPQP